MTRVARNKRVGSFVTRSLACATCLRGMPPRSLPRASAAALLLRALFGMFLIGVVGCDSVRRVQSNHQALQAMEKKQYVLAEKILVESLITQPREPLLNLNLGVNFELAKQYDKAINEYVSLQKYQDLPPELQFMGFFNAGNALAANKNVDEALKNYQAALDVAKVNQLNPEWLTETRTNIELLFRGGGGSGDGDGSSGEQQSQDPKQGGSNGKEKDDPKESKKEFKSQKLSPEDVKKILEELKAQEKKIRTQEQDGKRKESNPGKDW